MNEYEFVSSELLRYEELTQKERDLIYALLMGQIRLDDLNEKMRTKAVCIVAVKMHPYDIDYVPAIYREEILQHIEEYEFALAKREELRGQQAEAEDREREKEKKEKDRGMERAPI